MEELVREMLRDNLRLDGREFDGYRKVKVKSGLVKKAEGSAYVELGNTKVMAGVKLEVGTPFPDSPNEGVLIVNAEFSPIASPDFEPGPPSEDAVELARVVDRGIREANMIKLDQLVIEKGEKVWTVFVDLHMINHDGNLLDASALAAILALWNTKIPRLENDMPVRGEYERSLPVVFKPVAVTVGKFENRMLVDPTLEEEKVLDAKLTVCVRDDDKICAIQKQGSGTLSFEDVERIISLAIEKSKVLRGFI